MGKHYVAQELLRGFSSSPDRARVWMYDQRERSWSEPAIKRVAQEPDFYSEADESALARKVEATGHAALNRLRVGGRLANEERDDLAYYLAVQIMRVPAKRRRTERLAPGVMTETVRKIEASFESLRTPENSPRISQLLAETAEIETRYRGEMPDTVQEVIRSPWPSEAVFDAVRAMKWHVLKMPPGSKLVTSDNPLFFFGNLGLGSKGSELSIALSPDLGLRGYPIS